MPVRIKDRSGNARLTAWGKAFAQLPPVMKAMPKDLAEEAVDLTKQSFERQADPYGKPWAGLKLRSGRILQKTGGLKGSINRKTTPRGFVISVGRTYGAYHQLGTGLYGRSRRRIVPKRKKALGPIQPGNLFFRSVKGSPRRAFLPYRGLPPEWGKAFKEVALERVSKPFKKAMRSSSGGPGLVTARLAGFKGRFNAGALIRKAYKAIAEE